MSARVLVLEDDESLRLVITKALSRAGYEVRATRSPDTAVDRFLAREADALVADVLLGQENFLERLDEIRAGRPDGRVILISAQTTAATAIRAEKGGAFEYLPKPFDLDALVAAVDRAVRREGAVGETAAARAEAADSPFAGLVGRSAAMQAAFRALGRLAASDAPVLITGPDGSGRASAARVCHGAGPRAARPLVEAGPDRLAREGVAVFEAAEDGAVLLRRAEAWRPAVQDLVLERIERDVDRRVRIYATAEADVRERIAAPLFDRLAVGHAALPPLAERDRDAELLFAHFLRRHGLADFALGADARAFLAAASWPGEVRELERVAARIAVQGGRRDIDAALIREAAAAPAPPAPGDALARAAAAFAAARLAAGSDDLAREAQDVVDRAVIETALARAGGVRREAADRLGLNRNTLARRLAALGLDPDDGSGDAES